MDISTLSVRELKDLQKQISNAIVRGEKQIKDEIKKRIRSLAEQNGTTLEELFGVKIAGKKSGTPAKYRNPDDANQTWSGRGRTPRWMQERLSHGADKADFLI